MSIEPKLFNSSRQVLLAEQVYGALTFFKRLKGLMGTATLPDGTALLIKPCSSIHTWFMRYPIDVIFINRENRIIKILHSIPPYRLGPYVRGAVAAIELPAGRCGQTGTNEGDLVEFKVSPTRG
jgi:uncharacterized membrane protein (UPF0127 family)